MIKKLPSHLPYRDTKAVGAADFYFAINATFRFLLDRLGRSGLHRFWQDLGGDYFRPVSERWRQEGLSAIAGYWRDFFAAEPGGEVKVHQTGGSVELEVARCPAIAHLRSGQREIVPEYCQHCYFVSEAMAAPAGWTVRVEGGNGTCRQRFFQPDATTAPQDLDRISLCS